MIIRTFIVAVSLAISGIAGAGSGQNETLQLVPSDGLANDWFGVSVAISGTNVIVGADGDDDHGAGSGSAYLFDATTGRQIAKLLPFDGDTLDRFGRFVAISAKFAIVASPYDDDNGKSSGSAYLFDATTGEYLTKIVPEDNAERDRFSHSVAICGDTAILGAHDDDDIDTDSGSAYVFDVAIGEQIAKLLPADGAADDEFGYSVGISGSTAIVGTWLDDDNGINSGSAYLFDVTTGQQIAKLLPNDGAADDRFGNAVAIYGSTAIVGAYLDDDQGSESGSAYLFDVTTGEQIVKLLPKDGAAGARFGVSVAISGSTAIVSAYLDDDQGSNSGSAYVFDVTSGQQIAKLLPSDGAIEDWFGISVSISDSTAIVGSYFADNGATDSGSAYLFEIDADEPCDPPADFNCDGVVNASDLFLLLDNWGTCPRGEICAGDLNDDGTVNVADLLLLLSDWG